MYSTRYKPAWWLPGAHIQTVYSNLFRQPPQIPLIHQRLDLPDGDFLDLVWAADNYQDQDKPITILLHGLGGSIDSTYAQGLMQALVNAQQRPLFMHFRGASAEPNRLPRTYHSGDTQDLAYLIQYLKNHTPEINALGVSLGANVLLKYLGELGSTNPLNQAMAISPPFDLAAIAKHLQSGFPRVYQKYLLTKLKQQISRKLYQPNFPITQTQLNQIKTLEAFDDLITAPLNGFINAADYYRKSSCQQFLKFIEKPTLIIHAKNDPFMPTGIYPSPQDLSPAITLELTNNGGHVGFISGPHPGRAKYWLEERTRQWYDCTPIGV